MKVLRATVIASASALGLLAGTALAMAARNQFASEPAPHRPRAKAGAARTHRSLARRTSAKAASPSHAKHAVPAAA